MQLREDQYRINVEIGGVHLPPIYSWTSFEGAELQANSVFSRPGGMKPGLHLGAPQSRTDGTAKRPYTPELHFYMHLLQGVTGNNPTGPTPGNQLYPDGFVVITYMPLDGNGNEIPSVDYNHLTGVLKGVQKPAMDANADAAGFLTLVIAMNPEESTSASGPIKF